MPKRVLLAINGRARRGRAAREAAAEAFRARGHEVVAITRETPSSTANASRPATLPSVSTGLSLAEVRVLLTTVLPQPTFDLPAALRLLAYRQTRKAAAYRSHRRRTLSLLNQRRE